MINGNEAKKELKAAGFDTKAIRVYTRRGTGSLNVKVLDLGIDIEAVQAVLSKHERIDRCEATGEILQGCNRFVFVNYDYSDTVVPEALVDTFQAAVAAWGRLPEDNSGDRYHFGRAIMRENPSLSESQAYALLNRCMRKLAN